MSWICLKCGHSNNDNTAMCDSCGAFFERPIIKHEEINTATYVENTTNNYKINYTSKLRRLIAFIIDMFVLIIPATIIYIIFISINHYMNSDDRIIASFFMYLAYCAIMECSPLEGTVGKFVMHIAVKNKEGNRISIFRSIIRSFIKFFLIIIVSYQFADTMQPSYGILLYILTFGPMFILEKKKTLYDLISGTVLVDR